jgi:hypothetical protein
MTMGWAGYVARMGEKSGLCRVFVGRSVGKRPLRKLGSRREEFIEMNLH